MDTIVKSRVANLMATSCYLVTPLSRSYVDDGNLDFLGKTRKLPMVPATAYEASFAYRWLEPDQITTFWFDTHTLNNKLYYIMKKIIIIINKM